MPTKTPIRKAKKRIVTHPFPGELYIRKPLVYKGYKYTGWYLNGKPDTFIFENHSFGSQKEVKNIIDYRVEQKAKAKRSK